MKFTDRAEAGRTLAGKLQHYAGRDDTVVLGLPRGGVPVAFEIARDLAVPLEVFLVRKLGVPGQEEFAMGAIAEGGVTVLSQDLLLELGIPQRAVTEAIAREQQELERREQLYRGEWPAAAVAGKTGILVDDGLATVVCARTPEPFHAVGEWYEDFSQTTDEEVRQLLSLARNHAAQA
jgi:putative phosphoribosyl transferase